jgi:hypothetical protein
MLFELNATLVVLNNLRAKRVDFHGVLREARGRSLRLSLNRAMIL